MTTATADNGPSSEEPPARPAEDRVFDLTARVGWTNRFVLGGLGLLMTANGLANLARWSSSGETLVLVIGVISTCLGLLVLPGSFLSRRMNRLVIGFSQEDLSVKRGFLVWQRTPWDDIAGITLGRMAAEIATRGGKVRVIHFGLLGFADNQEIKPRVFQAIRDFARAKGITVTEEGAA